MAKDRPRKVPIISIEGRRDTKIVGAFRLASAICIAATLVFIGRLFDSSGQAAPAVIFALASGAFAYGELAWGGRAARRASPRGAASVQATSNWWPTAKPACCPVRQSVWGATASPWSG